MQRLETIVENQYDSATLCSAFGLSNLLQEFPRNLHGLRGFFLSALSDQRGHRYAWPPISLCSSFVNGLQFSLRVIPFPVAAFYSAIMRISVNIDMGRIVKGLDDLHRNQIPFAVAAALTATAKDVEQEEVKEIKDSFDRPKPETMSSLYVRPATKSKLEAVVGIKDFNGKGNPASKYLAAQITGGTRRFKRFERALQIAGVMPPDHYVVPGSAAALDAYGNIKPSLIVQLLSYFKAFPEMGYKANMSDKRKSALAKGSKKTGAQGVVYFVASDGWLHPGIWARYTFGKGSAVKPVLMFVQSSQYEKRFDFEYVAKKTVDRVFEQHLIAAWNKAWASARR